MLLVISVDAVTVICPDYIDNGDYEFSNPNSGNVEVTISNVPSSITVTPTNQFNLSVSQTKTINFATSGSENIYFKSFVKYADNSASAISLECNLFAYSASATTTTIPLTTTTIPKVNCGVDSGYKDGCYQGKYRDYYCYDTSPPSQCPADKCLIATEDCHTPCCTQYLGANGQCVAGECVIPGNNPPIINTYEPTDLTLTIFENETILFNHTSSDSNNDTLTYRWLENGEEKSTSQNWTYSPTSTGTKNITLVVSDDYLQDSQEWSVTVGSTTTTTTTTTSTITTTQDNSGGSSGGSGGSFGGSGGSTQTTGFYNFPAFVQVKSGKETNTEGFFYSKYRSDQTNVEFKISGLNSNWFTISPSSVSKVSYEEEVDIKITFNVPQDTKSGDYPFKISTKIGTITYDETITLTVTASQTITTTTTTIENTTNLEGEDQEKSPLTGFFTKAGDVAKKFWYVPVIPVVLFLAWKFLGPLFVKQETDYFPKEKTVKKEGKPKEGSDYLEIKQEKPKVEVKEIESELEIEKKPDEALIKAREKVRNEIRKRAMEEDKNPKK